MHDLCVLGRITQAISPSPPGCSSYREQVGGQFRCDRVLAICPPPPPGCSSYRGQDGGRKEPRTVDPGILGARGNGDGGYNDDVHGKAICPLPSGCDCYRRQRGGRVNSIGSKSPRRDENNRLQVSMKGCRWTCGNKNRTIIITITITSRAAVFYDKTPVCPYLQPWG